MILRQVETVSTDNAEDEVETVSQRVSRILERLPAQMSKAYVPQVVSLGPFYFGKPQLAKYESFKSKIPDITVDRAGRPPFTKLVEDMIDQCSKIRQWYKFFHNCPYSDEELGWIMARDGLFLLRFLRSSRQEHGIHAWTSEKEKKDRKGWLILIHDLSGSPVAVASMVTPFVPSHGTDHISRSNPGAWLILRPGPQGGNSWFPLARLEAWRERGRKGEISCKFKVMEEGGGFNGIGNTISLSRTVINCPKGNGDNVNINMELPIPGGFVMSVTTVNGEHDGKGKYSKLEVQLTMRHVTCLEDAAVFMALAAAVDLSVDACQPFSRRLTKDLGLSCSLL